jgi:hypothetical protein
MTTISAWSQLRLLQEMRAVKFMSRYEDIHRINLMHSFIIISLIPGQPMVLVVCAGHGENNENPN